jgi:hypothetical protein
MNRRGAGMDGVWVPNAIPTAGPTITRELGQLFREWKVEEGSSIIADTLFQNFSARFTRKLENEARRL